MDVGDLRRLVERLHEDASALDAERVIAERGGEHAAAERLGAKRSGVLLALAHVCALAESERTGQ